MLQWLRENLKSFAWTLWLVIAAFIILYIPDLFAPNRLSTDEVAAVGDETITLNEYARAYKATEDRFRQALGPQYTPELASQLGMAQQAFNQVIGQKILVREARRMGLAVSDEELSESIASLPGFQDGSGRFIGADLYANIVRSNGSSVEDFERSYREALMVDKLQSVLASNLYLTDEAVEDRYRRDVERATVRWVELPSSRFAEDVQVTDGEISSYFDTHQDEYRRPEQRVVSYLLVDAGMMRNALEVSDADLRAYYDDNQEQFTTPEQVRARHILLRVDDDRSEAEAARQMAEIERRLAAGESFAALAEELSEDPGSAAQGGDLGFFGRGAMVPEFEEAAFATPVGERTEPVRSSFGYHLIEVTDRREGGGRSFEEVKNQIRIRLQGERVGTAVENKAGEIRSQVTKLDAVTPEAMARIAEQTEGVSFATTPAFGPEDPIGQLGRAPAFASAAFSLDKGEVSDPVQVPRGWAVLHVDDVLDSRVPELDEVREEIRQALTLEKQGELALERLTEARRRIEAGELTLQQLADEISVGVQQSEEFGRGQPIAQLPGAPSVSEKAFELAEGEVGEPIETRGGEGAVLFQVASRTEWDRAAFEAAKEDTRAQLEAEEVQRVISSVVAERMRDPEVTYNQAVLERYEIQPPS